MRSLNASYPSYQQKIIYIYNIYIYIYIYIYLYIYILLYIYIYICSTQISVISSNGFRLADLSPLESWLHQKLALEA